jgi:hypothetical protein
LVKEKGYGVLKCAAALCLAQSVLLGANYSITGTVTRADNSVVEGLTVVLEKNGSPIEQYLTDPKGVYAFSVQGDTYSQLRVRNQGTIIAGLPRQIEQTAANTIVLGKDTTINIKLPPYCHVHGTVLSSAGDTIKKAAIEAKRWISGAQSTPWDNTMSDSVTGAYSMYQQAGGSKVWITPPAGQGFIFTTFEYTLTKDTLINLVLPKSIILSGIVTNQHGDSLRGIGVTVETGPSQQVDSFTNGMGRYAIPLNPGTVNIRLRNQGRDVNGMPRQIESTIVTGMALTKDSVLNLKIPLYPAVRCSVVDIAGNPANNIALYAKQWQGGGEQPPWDWDTTKVNGTATLYLSPNSNKLWITPPAGSDYIPSTAIVTTPHDTTITIALLQGVMLSGTVFRSDTTPVAGLDITARKDIDYVRTQTDAAGHYSIKLQPATYELSVSNPTTPIPGLPQMFGFTAQDTMIISTARTLDIHLPFYPVITGIIKDPAGNPVNNVQIAAKRWIFGAESSPWAQSTTGIDGAYSLIVGKGINKVWVTPPIGPLGKLEFIESFDTSIVKDIILADKAKGIKRIQPSVVSTGQGGMVMINGIGCDFSGSPAIDLGAGIAVSNVKVISSITLTADISVAQTAATGSRDVKVTMGATTIIGPNLLTITPPASDTLELDAQGKTTDTVIISDGTGTQLLIPAGTPVSLPPGSDSIVSFVAPIIKDTVTKPIGGEFTDVQRDLGPSGLTFGDTVILTSSYKNQDVEGLNESTLKPFYFTDGATASSGATVGDSMAILKRDTAGNTLSFVMTHFSMFRLASAAPVRTVREIRITQPAPTQLVALRGFSPSNAMVQFYIGADQAATRVTLTILDLRGKAIRTLINGIIGQGMHTTAWDGTSGNTLMASGQYICKLSVGEIKQQMKFILIR